MFEQMLANYEESPVPGQSTKISSVAVIGADPVGQAIACSALTAGCRVTLHTPFDSEYRKLVDAESISVDGGTSAGTHRVAPVDTNVHEPTIQAAPQLDVAVKHADVVLLTGPASVHATYATLLAPLLKTGQIVVLAPGQSMGALEVARVLRNQRSRADAIVLEMCIAPYIVTQPHPGHLIVEAEHRVVLAAALSNADTASVVDSMRHLFPMLRAADSVLETSFANMAGLLLAAPALLAASAQGRATLRDRLPVELVETVVRRLDQERMRTAFAYGVRDLSSLSEWLEATFGTVEKDLGNALDEIAVYGKIPCPAPDDPAVHDAVATSLVPLASAAATAGVPTPVTSAMITLASALHGIDHARNGRTMASLGLEGMRPDEIRRAIDGADAALAQEVLT
ncbi:MAG: NAD/NADP octopine/nopaline dehydrogenase family protein [Leucobacter sp.]